MQRPLPLLAVTVALFAFASVAFAQCPPSSVSVCYAAILDDDACPPSGIPELIWCPAGDMSRIELVVKANGSAGNPCPDCELEVRVQIKGEPNTATGGPGLWATGTNTGAGAYTLIDTTDANGEVRLEFTGGGCGCIEFSYIVLSNCGPVPFILCQGQEYFCVKSPDITGDGRIDFFDNFKYIPMLLTFQGYCGDLTCDGTVNFFDNFEYIPHLLGLHTGTGSILPFAPCGIACQ